MALRVFTKTDSELPAVRSRTKDQDYSLSSTKGGAKLFEVM